MTEPQPERPRGRGQALFLVLSLALASLLFFNSRGTPDVNLWKKWAENAEAHGVVAGYAANRADYPPLASVVLAGTARLADLDATESVPAMKQVRAVKVAILVFLALTTLVFWAWTRDLVLAALLHVALLLGSAGLSYLDVFLAPALLLALRALQARRIAAFAAWFTVSFLFKWQPLVLAPFLVVQVVAARPLADGGNAGVRRVLLRAAAAALAVLVPVVAIFGPGPVGRAFAASLSHDMLSGNALNFQWIVTHALQTIDPATWGGFHDGNALPIKVAPDWARWLGTALFAATAGTALVAWIRREKTFENALLFALVGYLAYFTFAIGVHENHLFLATLLAVTLAWLDRRHRLVAATIVLMTNLNLLLFYGIDGRKLPFDRVLFDAVDLAVVFSIANVAFFVYFWAVVVFARRDAAR